TPMRPRALTSFSTFLAARSAARRSARFLGSRRGIRTSDDLPVALHGDGVHDLGGWAVVAPGRDRAVPVDRHGVLDQLHGRLVEARVHDTVPLEGDDVRVVS